MKQFIFLLMLLPCSAWGQTIAPLPKADLTTEQVVKNRIKNADEKSYFSVSIENDFLGSNNDANYTSGVRFTYFNVNTSVPPLLDELAMAIPTFDLNETTSTYLSLGQNLYTPEDIQTRNLQADDRPYAGYLYVSAGLATLNNDHIDELELTLGVVGPEALGEQTQKFIHKHISPSSPTPNGWGNQLDFEPAIGLSAGRRWPSLYSKAFANLQMNIEPNVNVTLGNVYTHAGAGLSLTLGPNYDAIQDKPPRVPPAIPGTGFFETPDQGWSWYVFGGLNGRAIGRNIFLDGNTFSNSHSVDKNYFVGDATLGVAMTLDRYRLAYSYNMRSREFKEQDDDYASFGSLTLSTRF